MTYSNFDVRCAGEQSSGLVLSDEQQSRLHEIAEQERLRRQEARRQYNREWWRKRREQQRQEEKAAAANISAADT